MTNILHTAGESINDLYDALAELEQCRSECAAEAGMGAVSMGFDGYDAMNAYRANIEPSPWEVEARARIAEHEAANPRVPVAVSPAADDDIPF